VVQDHVITRCVTIFVDHYDYSTDHMSINVLPSGGNEDESSLLLATSDTTKVTTYEFQIRQQQQT